MSIKWDLRPVWLIIINDYNYNDEKLNYIALLCIVFTNEIKHNNNGNYNTNWIILNEKNNWNLLIFTWFNWFISSWEDWTF